MAKQILTLGIKKNLGVDSLGLPFFTLCTKASLSDDKALLEMFAQNIDYRTLANANARIHLCFIRFMLKRLAKAS
ncbi:hypothetical protein B9G53_13175 [Pseudanabaena sp. SR411]|uniref:hypothetical protein n=1 Tax=Pseudanabaena sp. SR411 TaxID=1980935 RepID=UPI000B999FDF|nr:hypothetical protein [Pseudanabaena sp. SR411]OYQ64118.1 hypothetical protein B9G53_13175 [Pseudanabaena sp. SR411]